MELPKGLIDDKVEPSHKVEDIGIFLETHGVDVLAVMETGIHVPLSRTRRRRPLSTADIMSILHQPGYKILLPAIWSQLQQTRMFSHYRDTLRIKEIKVHLTLLTFHSYQWRSARAGKEAPFSPVSMENTWEDKESFPCGAPCPLGIRIFFLWGILI